MFRWILSFSLPSALCASVDTNAPAFALQIAPSQYSIGRPRRSRLCFKTIDSIDGDQLAQSSNTEVDGADVGIAEDSHSPNDALGEDHVEERNDLASATRTLGSLFLRQEDADRNKDVDVFGRPLLTNETEDNDSSPFNLQETSFAKYLMSLKHQEEDNRERAAATEQSKPESVVNGRRSSDEKSSDLHIDQVSEESHGCLLNVSLTDKSYQCFNT